MTERDQQPGRPISDDTESTSVRVAGFETIRRIGSGGYSTVYSARQTRMGRPVAIKVLRADMSSRSDRLLFERECQAMGVLSRHPNIVTVYSDADTSDGSACLVMELYHGNYRERLERTGPLPIDELLVVGIKIAGALQAAHDMGVLHRDIKPHNIFLSDFDEPALGDFGISRIDDERSVTGAAALSIAYSAPEVIEDGRADYLSDVYSLAASLYHLAEGTSPFAAPQVGGVIRRILDDDPAPLSRTDATPALDALLRAGLAKDPTRRPDSAGAFASSLQDIQVALGREPTSIPLRLTERHDRPDVADETSGRQPRRVLRPEVAADAETTILPDELLPLRSERSDRGEPDSPPVPTRAAAPVRETEQTSPTIRRPADVFSPQHRPDPPPEQAIAVASVEETSPTIQRPRNVLSPGHRPESAPPAPEPAWASPWWARRWVGVALVVAIVALVAYASIGLL